MKSGGGVAAAPFDLIAEAKKLVRFNTVTRLSNADCAVWMGSLMRRLGLTVAYQESREAGELFMNVVGLQGEGKEPLLLTTHLDTVDAGNPKLWTKTSADPWRLTLHGQTLYGLGCADTKLDLLCKLMAFARCKPNRWKRSLVFLGTFGEESGLRGAARFCQGDLPRPGMALVGEPTDLSLVTRHKGFMVIELIFRSKGLFRPEQKGWVYTATFQGQASHSSTPALGINALDRSRSFLQDLAKRYGKVIALEWEGGQGHNVIPASSRLRFSLGPRAKVSLRSSSSQKVQVQPLAPGWYSTLPWEEAMTSIETLASVLSPHQKNQDKAFDPSGLTWNLTQMIHEKEGWILRFDLRPLPGQSLHRAVQTFEQKLWKQLGHPGAPWQFRLERDNPALELKEKSPLIREAKAAFRAAHIPFRLAAKAGCSEAGLYQRVGIPSAVFGPGRSVGNIHRPNESVSIPQLKSAIRFYENFLERVCC